MMSALIIATALTGQFSGQLYGAQPRYTPMGIAPNFVSPFGQPSPPRAVPPGLPITFPGALTNGHGTIIMYVGTGQHLGLANDPPIPVASRGSISGRSLVRAHKKRAQSPTAS